MYSLRACSKFLAQLHKISVSDKVSQRYIKRWIAPTLMELTKRKKQQKNPIVNPRSKYIEWNRKAELYAFNNRLSEKFDMNLLEQAFTHRSYIIQEEEEQRKVGIENPELNMLDNRELINEGKLIVSVVVQAYLKQVLPLAHEECIYALKSYLLSTPVLAKTSSGIGTKDLVLSKDFPVEEETLATTFCALISALNRSVNLEHASVFVRDILIATLVDKDLLEIWCPDNPVELLNNILLNEHRKLAEPRIIAQTGINTLLPVYRIGIYSNKEFLGSGFGETVEEAEKIAALNALQKMFGLLDSSKPLRCNLKLEESNLQNLLLIQQKSTGF